MLTIKKYPIFAVIFMATLFITYFSFAQVCPKPTLAYQTLLYTEAGAEPTCGFDNTIVQRMCLGSECSSTFVSCSSTGTTTTDGSIGLG